MPENSDTVVVRDPRDLPDVSPAALPDLGPGELKVVAEQPDPIAGLPTASDLSCDGSPGSTPLVGLLSRCKDLFTAEFDARLARSEFAALSLAHSNNVLRHLGEGPRRASQIVTQCRVSKQAVSQQIVHLEKNGYVDVVPDPADQRARLLNLTPKGERAQRFVLRTFVEIEHDWAALIGVRDAASLRRVLTKVVERSATRPC